MERIPGAITAAIKAARARKKMSQRLLSERTGLPQSHISRIEAGQIDLQTSSLVQIARALDMELMLVPRRALPSVKAEVALSERHQSAERQEAAAHSIPVSEGRDIWKSRAAFRGRP